MNEQDAWAHLNGSQPDDVDVVEPSANAAGEVPHDESVYEAQAVEVPPKRNAWGPRIVIGAIALVVVGVAGSGVYGLYSKIFPSKGGSERNASEVDPAAAAAAMSVQAAGAGNSPGAQGVVPPGARRASDAAVIPSSPGVAAPPSEPVAEAPSRSASAMVPPQSSPAAPAVVSAAPAAASTGVVPPAVAPTTTRAAEPVDSAATQQTATKAEHPSATASRSRTNSQGEHKAGRMHSESAKARSGAKEGRAKKKPATSEPVEEVISDSRSLLVRSYRIESIEPKFGEHQVAWLRGPQGRLRIVSNGDTFDGVRVLKVDGQKYSVSTNQGEIR